MTNKGKYGIITTELRKEGNTMYEYEIMNRETGEHSILCGSSYSKCMEKAGYDEKDYILIMTEYVD